MRRIVYDCMIQLDLNNNKGVSNRFDNLKRMFKLIFENNILFATTWHGTYGRIW